MILLVDDDPAALEQAREVLDKTCQVLLASDGEQAFAMARKLGFSVAIVDLNLHGKGGLDLIRRLHADLPIIAICGQVQGQLLRTLKDLGVVEMLNKPITPPMEGGGGTNSGTAASTEFRGCYCLAAFHRRIERSGRRQAKSAMESSYALRRS